MAVAYKTQKCPDIVRTMRGASSSMLLNDQGRMAMIVHAPI